MFSGILPLFDCLLLVPSHAASDAFDRKQGLRSGLVDAAAAAGGGARGAAWNVETALATHRRHKLHVTQLERAASPRIEPVYVGDSDAACAALPQRKLMPAEVLRGCHWDYDKITKPRHTCPAQSPLARQATLKATGKGTPAERPFKAAMVYLCIPVEACHFEYLALSIMSWHHYWNRYFNYPVVIFSEAKDVASITTEIAPLVASAGTGHAGALQREPTSFSQEDVSAFEFWSDGMRFYAIAVAEDLNMREIAAFRALFGVRRIHQVAQGTFV